MIAKAKARTKAYSTPELANRWGVNISKVGEWIRSGELRAINIAQSLGKQRPRYRVTVEAVAEFEQRRAVYQPAEEAAV